MILYRRACRSPAVVRGGRRAPAGWSHQSPAPDCTSVFSLCCNYKLVLLTVSKNGEVTDRTLLISSQHSHSRQIPLETERELSFLAVSGRRNLPIIRVSHFQWTFPYWAGMSISWCHRAYTCHILRSTFLLHHVYGEPHMLSHLYNLPKPGMGIC